MLGRRKSVPKLNGDFAFAGRRESVPKLNGDFAFAGRRKSDFAFAGRRESLRAAPRLLVVLPGLW